MSWCVFSNYARKVPIDPAPLPLQISRGLYPGGFFVRIGGLRFGAWLGLKEERKSGTEIFLMGDAATDNWVSLFFPAILCTGTLPEIPGKI